MARPGIDYETVKHTAIKLLAQGSAPSMQKIREALNTKKIQYDGRLQEKEAVISEHQRKNSKKIQLKKAHS